MIVIYCQLKITQRHKKYLTSVNYQKHYLKKNVNKTEGQVGIKF